MKNQTRSVGTVFHAQTLAATKKRELQGVACEEAEDLKVMRGYRYRFHCMIQLQFDRSPVGQAERIE